MDSQARLIWLSPHHADHTEIHAFSVIIINNMDEIPGTQAPMGEPPPKVSKLI